MVIELYLRKMIRKILLRFIPEYKQVIIVRQDLKLPKGKLAVQVAHASVNCALACSDKKVRKWKKQGAKKIVLKVKTLHQLKKYHELAKKKRIVTRLISDAGLTTVRPGTVTCLGIGPDFSEKINRITGELKML